MKDLADRRTSVSSALRSSAPAEAVLEGYLYKFSSGTLTSRWQKRYFVLKDSGLEYFGKQSHAKASVAGASVNFPMRRIKSVSQGATSKEFELTIGTTKRKYFIKAASNEICRLWIAALSRAIGSHPDSGSGDSVASEDANESDLIGGSSLNDNSSSRSVGIVPSEGGEVAVTDTVWEQPEISSEEVDALFSEWFVFLEDPRSDIKAGRMIDAASRAVSDLWSVVAHLPRGEDVSFEQAKDSLISRITASNGPERASLTTGEYVMRLCQKFYQWLNRRNSSDDIPVLIEWTSRFRRNLNSLGLGVASLDDSVSSNPEGVSPTHSEGGGITASSDKWPRAMKQLIRKLGAEWEVGLIEQLQLAMPQDSVWDLPAVESSITPQTPHGPFRSVPTSLGAPSQPILITSWTETYLSRLSAVCFAQSTAKGTPWQAAYPTCSLLLTTHAASAIVASLNACWRAFKGRTATYAKHKASAVGSMMKKMKTFTGRLSITSPTRERPPIPPISKLVTAIENLMAFGNEATLTSVFCQHASALSEFRSASPAFAACLEGLSAAFANTSNEVARVIVKLHFLKIHRKTILAAFDPKSLAVRVKVPISETLDLAKDFIDSLPSRGCHDLLRYLIVGQVMQGVANAYVTSLIWHKPKTVKFTRLAAVVAEDEGLFFSMFKELGRPATEINTAIDQISHVHTVLSEQNLAPPSRGGVPLVQECVELTKAFPSSQKALEVVKALLDMRGISKSDRRDIIYSVTACMQRHAESPSPAFLDISREEEDEDMEPHDGSGFSSNRSSSKTAEESP